jgi:hypothetical protein
MTDLELEALTLAAIEGFLRDQYHGKSVTLEPRTATRREFAIGTSPAQVVAVSDTLLATIVNNRGHMENEHVAKMFDTGDVLAKMERSAKTGKRVMVKSTAGATEEY